MTDARALREAIDETLASRFTDQETYLAYPATPHFAVARAEAISVFDEYHNEYLDFSAGGAVMNLGHANPLIDHAVRDHLAHYTHTASGQGEQALRFPAEYAHALSETFPVRDGSPQQVLYCADEGEARRMADTLARHASGGAPGHVLDLLSPLGDPLDRDVVADKARRARTQGILVIVDETRTGYGRLGTLWGQQAWDVEADITVLGGAGGGGFPFGAVVAPASCFTNYRPDVSGQAGNPVICAAGRAVLDQLTLPLLAHVGDAGHVLTETLIDLAIQFPEIVTGHRGVGLLQNLTLSDPATARRFYLDALTHGLLLVPPVPGSAAVGLTPPLVASENEIRRGVDLLAGVCLDWTDPA